ncbi:MAG: hypothetical protein WCH60_11550 [Burkholderiales bacterium]
MGKASDASLALEEAFFKCIPSANKKKRLSEAEWDKALQAFHRDARAIRSRFSLGPIARAFATYQFQKRLFVAGFDGDVVRKVVFSLVLNAFISAS